MTSISLARVFSGNVKFIEHRKYYILVDLKPPVSGTLCDVRFQKPIRLMKIRKDILHIDGVKEANSLKYCLNCILNNSFSTIYLFTFTTRELKFYVLF